MFLGAGGSGKSSLLDGLMNLPFRDTTDSTPLADTRSITYQWIEAAGVTEAAWERYCEDESNELVELSDLAMKNETCN